MASRGRHAAGTSANVDVLVRLRSRYVATTDFYRFKRRLMSGSASTEDLRRILRLAVVSPGGRTRTWLHLIGPAKYQDFLVALREAWAERDARLGRVVRA